MKNVSYVDLLLEGILSAKNREKLLFLRDDMDIANGLGQINNNDIRVLNIALQGRMSYLIFSDVLGELENLNGIMRPEDMLKKFEDEVTDLDNIVLLKK